MKYLQTVQRVGKIAFLTIGGWLVVHGTCLAQAQGAAKQPDPEGGSYVFSYAMVMLGVGLGLLLVCRPSHRRDRARPELYDESKALVKD